MTPKQAMATVELRAALRKRFGFVDPLSDAIIACARRECAAFCDRLECIFDENQPSETPQCNMQKQNEVRL